MRAFFVPLKGDKEGHILFLETIYGITNIFKSTYFSKDIPPSQNRIGTYTGELNEIFITQWCYAQFNNCPKHPAIIKINFDTMKQELYYSDEYIEDFIAKNYDKIIGALNENNSSKQI